MPTPPYHEMAVEVHTGGFAVLSPVKHQPDPEARKTATIQLPDSVRVHVPN